MGRYKEIIQMLGFEDDRYILEKKGIQEWIKQCGEDNVYEECRKIVANNRKKLKKVKWYYGMTILLYNRYHEGEKQRLLVEWCEKRLICHPLAGEF